MKVGITEIIILLLIAAIAFRPYLVRIARRIRWRLSVYMDHQFHMLEKASQEAWRALKLLCIGIVVFLLLFILSIGFILTH